MKPLNILILHCMGPEDKWFSGVADVELMFPRYDKINNYLVHNCYLKIPIFISEFQFDAIIMMSTFMDKVAMGGLESRWIQRFKFIKESTSFKIVFPQDDYWFSENRDKFYVDYRVDRVYPVCDESVWKELIPKYLEGGGVAKQGFTTYITPNILEKQEFQKKWAERKNDVVYRAKKTPAAPNRYGYIKGVIGERFLEAAASRNLITDISTDPEKLIHGDKWVNFLADSRAILGSNSGSSVRLRNGEIFNSLLKYQINNPAASWSEVEEHIFDAVDRGKDYTAISPRNIESAMVGTLQILTPGHYSGLMKPYKEYIPLEEDCSNAQEVVNFLNDEVFCQKIIDSCLKTFINEPKLRVENLIEEVVNLIRIKSLLMMDKNIEFNNIKMRHEVFVRYWSFIPKIMLVSKIKVSSLFSRNFKNKLKKFLFFIR